MRVGMAAVLKAVGEKKNPRTITFYTKIKISILKYARKSLVVVHFALIPRAFVNVCLRRKLKPNSQK